jgi:hypothetical protein
MMAERNLTDSDSKPMNQLDRIERKLDAIDTTLRGDGRGVVGHATRLDRLEQANAERKWWGRTVIGASVGAVIAAAFALLKSGG